MLRKTLLAHDAFRAIGGGATIAELQRRLDVHPSHQRLFLAVIDILRRIGCLSVEGDVVVVDDSAHTRPTAIDAARVITAHPDLSVHVQILEKSIVALPDIFAGRRNPMEMLFPQGSFDDEGRLQWRQRGSGDGLHNGERPRLRLVNLDRNRALAFLTLGQLVLWSVRRRGRARSCRPMRD